MIKRLFVLAFLSISFNAPSQVSGIVLNGKTFGACELNEVVIGANRISIRLAEKNLENETFASGEDMPGVLGLILEFDFSQGLVFPVSPSDTVIFEHTFFEISALDKKNDQFNRLPLDRIESKAEILENNKAGIEKKAKEISQKLIRGEITPDEAAKRIEALTTHIGNQVENESFSKHEFIELPKKSYFSLLFYDTNTFEELQVYAGRAIVKKIDEKYLDIQIKGKAIVSCMSYRSATSVESEKDCSKVQAPFQEGLKVLRLEDFTGSIKVAVDKFFDDR